MKRRASAPSPAWRSLPGEKGEARPRPAGSRRWSWLLLGLGLACGALRAPPLGVPPDAGLPDAGFAAFDAGATGGGGGSGLALERACGVLNAARCQALVRCSLLGAAGVAACVDTLERSWCGPGTWPAHVAQGGLRYDAATAQACADALSTSACADYPSLPEACTRFLKPNAGLRAPCFDGFDDCTEGVCRGAACPRTCQLPGLAGEVCAGDADCRAGLGLFCRLSATATGVGQCALVSQEGETCDATTRCAGAMWCVGGRCQWPPTRGQPCLLGRCEEASFCTALGDAGLCVLRSPEGATCLDGQCQASLRCDPARGACVPQLAPAGAPCSAVQACAEGTACVGPFPGLCRAPLLAGAGCTRDAECAADLACLSSDAGSACGPRQPTGAPCRSDRGCQVDATCSAGTCARLPGPGEPCDGACRSGTCLANPQDGGRLCGPFLGSGAPCAADAQCDSHRCALGACQAACTP